MGILNNEQTDELAPFEGRAFKPLMRPETYWDVIANVG